MYLYQNIIRADSENFFQWRGKGLQTLISRTQKLFAANYFLTIPPKLPPPTLPPPPTLLYLQLHKYFTINKISRWVWNWYVILSWMVRSLRLPQSDPPPLWKIMVTTLLTVARWAGLIRKGEGSAKNRAETMGKYSTDSEENWFSDPRSKRNSSQLCLQ